MPIFDIQSDVDAEYPRLFVLKKGDPKPNNGIGREKPHWRAHGDHPSVSDFYETEQVKEQDGKPTELRVYLAGNTMSEVFDPWMREYASGKLKRKCDTKHQSVWLNEVTGEYIGKDPKPCERGACECKPRGGLKVFVDGLSYVGYVEVQTGSVWDIRTLTSRLRKLSQDLDKLNGLRASFGLEPITLAGIPCIIRRTARDTTYNDNGKRKSAGTKYFIDLGPDPGWFEMQRNTMQRAASMRLEDMQAMQRPVALLQQHGHNGGNGYTTVDSRTVDPLTGEILDDIDEVPFDFGDDDDATLDDEVDFMERDEVPAITDEQRDEIDTLGVEIFGVDGWKEAAIHGFNVATGRDDITGIGDLTMPEADMVIKRLEVKKKTLPTEKA